MSNPSTVPTFEQRGLFWWHGEPIPDRLFAPEDAVLGLLSIDENGIATLILDGYMPNDNGAWALLSQEPDELKGKTIEGKLVESGKHILLLDLVRYGVHFRSNNLSQDGYRASNCLVSPLAFPILSADTLFSALTIDSKGMKNGYACPRSNRLGLHRAYQWSIIRQILLIFRSMGGCYPLYTRFSAPCWGPIEMIVCLWKRRRFLFFDLERRWISAECDGDSSHLRSFL